MGPLLRYDHLQNVNHVIVRVFCINEYEFSYIVINNVNLHEFKIIIYQHLPLYGKTTRSNINMQAVTLLIMCCIMISCKCGSSTIKHSYSCKVCSVESQCTTLCKYIVLTWSKQSVFVCWLGCITSRSLSCYTCMNYTSIHTHYTKIIPKINYTCSVYSIQQTIDLKHIKSQQTMHVYR